MRPDCQEGLQPWFVKQVYPHLMTMTDWLTDYSPWFEIRLLTLRRSLSLHLELDAGNKVSTTRRASQARCQVSFIPYVLGPSDNFRSFACFCPQEASHSYVPFFEERTGQHLAKCLDQIAKVPLTG